MVRRTARTGDCQTSWGGIPIPSLAILAVGDSHAASVWSVTLAKIKINMKRGMLSSSLHGKLHKNAKGEEVITSAGFEAGAKGATAPAKPAAPAKDK